METLISSLSPQHVFPIQHGSDVAAARRVGQKLADELGFDDVRAGRLAIIVTEAATNILKHAGEGATARLAFDKDGADLVLRIEDDGGAAGQADPGPDGHGLAGMRERVAAVGGSLRHAS